MAVNKNVHIIMICSRLVLFLLALVCYESVEAGLGRWTSNGPYSGYGAISFDTYDSNVVYSSSGALFRSSNLGKSWEELETPGPFDLIVPHPIIRNQLLGVALPVGSSTLFVYRSLDQGSSWQFVSQTVLNPFYFYSTLTDFEFDQSGMALYATAYRIGLFKSIDGGITWHRVTDGLPPPRQFHAVIDVDPSNSQLIYMLMTNLKTRKVSFLKSVNGGETWKSAGHGLDLVPGNLILELDSLKPDLIYAGSRKLYKSSNRGETWFNIPFPGGEEAAGTEIYSLTIDQKNSNNLYLISNFKAVKSSDGGRTWQFLKFPFFFEPTFQIAVHPRLDQIIFASGPGFLRSNDHGKTWKPADFGITTSVKWLKESISEPDKIFAGGLNIFRTRDAGAHWNVYFRTKKSFRQASQMAIHPHNPKIMALRGYELPDSFNFGITGNGGKTWNFSNAPLGNIEFDPENTNTVYVAQAKSTDFGRTWRQFNFGRVQDGLIIRIDSRNPSNLYALVENSIYHTNSIYYSSDAGMNWKPIARLDRFIKPVFNFILSPSNPKVMYAFGTGGVVISTDAGVHWNKRNNGLSYSPNITSLTVDPGDEKKLYAIDYGSQLFYSTDSGQTWIPFDRTGLTEDTLNAVTIDPSDQRTILAATNKGVFTYTRSVP